MGTVTNSFTTYGGNSGDWMITKYRSKQAAPVDRTMPLQYYTSRKKLLSGVSGRGTLNPYYSFNETSTWQDTLWAGNARNDEQFTSSGPMVNLPSGTEWQKAYARAYSKFLGSIYERAAMMTNIAERGQTVQMLTKRLSQILQGARQLKAGKFRSFLKTFGVKPKKEHEGLMWTRPKQFASLWLEYWFGWAPVINDIYTATANYGKPINDQTVKQGSQVKWYDSYSANPSGATVRSWAEGSVRVTICGRVKVDNPSLFELNRLGLVNPAVTALEVIPFSWLYGWFGNLQQVLSQYTDFVGLTLKDATVSTKTKRVFFHDHTSYGYTNRWSASFTSYGRRKVTTLPKVSLVHRLPNGLSVTRGATLASLVVQLFAPKR